MIQIIGTRQSGRTTRLIRLCKRLNEENGSNDTIILVSDRNRARIIMKKAEEMGCGDIPFPALLCDINRLHTTRYKRVLIDDLETFVQMSLGVWELAGYVIKGPDKFEGHEHGWISEQEV